MDEVKQLHLYNVLISSFFCYKVQTKIISCNWVLLYLYLYRSSCESESVLCTI